MINIFSVILLAVCIAVAFLALDKLEKTIVAKAKKRREKLNGTDANGTAPHD